MAVYAEVDHIIVGYSVDSMALTDEVSTATICTAIRGGFAQPWVVHIDGLDDVEVPTNGTDRADVMTAMEEHTFLHLGPKDAEGHGYLTRRPRELSSLP